ncbi:hypothetical protein KG112_18075 [Nocardioides sp. zg-ZUI104]|uniref:hypothetical protein n=1 Tax=Nocardioides faecalis TaxID=2803858 RepID=UPI001BCC6FE7|nr:hypothetical protein [Nocardioides faecalis]MBS4754718.1 hypothetical protein [Nocardioides faecalis]
MSAKRLTRPMVERTVHMIDNSGVLDILAPPTPKGQRGRKGQIRANTRLWAIGVILCTRLGHETTVAGVHGVLTEALPRDLQWQLGVLRPLTTKAAKPRSFDPEQARLTKNGKPRKEIWADEGYERIGYDDLVNVAAKIKDRLDYGYGTAPDVSDEERDWRRTQVEDVVDRLITISVIPRSCTTCAIDGTGQWSWNIGPRKERTDAQKRLDTGAAHAPSEDVSTSLQVTPISAEDTPAPQGQATGALRHCLDAAWGYKTGKAGQKEVGYGFHQHTVVRTADPNSTGRPEPLLVEGLVVVPANEDVVEASLRLLDRIQLRSKITRLAGDLLYTNLKADRWAVPLAQRGIEQILAMREDGGGCVDINGAVMQYGWMHCPAAPMDQRPLPATFARDEDEEHYDAVEEFKANWAFDRKESGLGSNPSSKWICPAMAGRGGCWARGTDNVTVAQEAGLPIITPPQDWESRPCCTNKTMDFTPDPKNPHHQRKLMQREYVGTRRWRRAFNLRSSVEGAFGILKNPSRQRLRRGQNRLPGLAMANLINGLKVAVFNEEQLRSWHEDTGLGPADHPLLQPDPHDWGFTDLTKAQAKEIDDSYLRASRKETLRAVPDAA